MLSRILFTLIAACSCVWLTACWSDNIPNHYDGDLEFDLYIAPEVEVPITLRYGTQLGARPAKILDLKASKTSGLKWSDYKTDGLDIEFKLQGQKVGRHDLFVKYRDRDGRKRKQTFSVHVAEVDHTKARPVCDGSSSTDRHLVAPGSKVRVFLSAYDVDGNRLSSGELDLVRDADGFDEVAGLWVAPEKPGTYKWDLLGSNSEFEITVYDPANLAPTLSVPTRAVDERARVVVDVAYQQEAENESVCTRPSTLRVDLETVDGECVPAVGSFELDGLSLDVGAGARTIGVVGNESCTVRARSALGNREVETSVEVDQLVESKLTADFEIVQGTELEVISAPEESLALDRTWATCAVHSVDRESTKCPVGYWLRGDAGAGCIKDMDWTVSYVEPGEKELKAALGTGLWTELEFRLDAKGNDREVGGLDMPPSALTMEPSFPELSWVELGCTPHKRIFQLSASAAADFELSYDARNAIEPKAHTIRSRDIGSMKLTRIVEPDENENSENEVLQREEGSLRHWFIGETQSLGVRYFDSEGERLRGVGSVLVRAMDPDSETAVRRSLEHWTFDIFAGNQKNVLEVVSPHVPSVHKIVVEDGRGIAEFTGLDVVRFVDSKPYCFSVKPFAEDGLPIVGQWPVLPRIRGSRGKLLAQENSVDKSQLCFVGSSPGKVELDLSWGSAEAQVTWTVE